MLTQAGITAVCCEQLDELTEALRTQTFDLLLSDVQMPAINGFDLLRTAPCLEHRASPHHPHHGGDGAQ